MILESGAIEQCRSWQSTHHKLHIPNSFALCVQEVGKVDEVHLCRINLLDKPCDSANDFMCPQRMMLNCFYPQLACMMWYIGYEVRLQAMSAM